MEMCLRTIALSPTSTCSVFLVCLKRRSHAPSQRLHGVVFSQTGKRKSDDDKDWKGHLAKDKVGFWLCVWICDHVGHAEQFLKLKIWVAPSLNVHSTSTG